MDCNCGAPATEEQLWFCEEDTCGSTIDDDCVESGDCQTADGRILCHYCIETCSICEKKYAESEIESCANCNADFCIFECQSTNCECHCNKDECNTCEYCLENDGCLSDHDCQCDHCEEQVYTAEHRKFIDCNLCEGAQFEYFECLKNCCGNHLLDFRNGIHIVYILRDRDAYKIGITKSWDSRVRAYRTHNPQFVLLFSFNAESKLRATALENYLLTTFKELRIQNDNDRESEWLTDVKVQDIINEIAKWRNQIPDIGRIRLDDQPQGIAVPPAYPQIMFF